jgi:hypothetical protein
VKNVTVRKVRISEIKATEGFNPRSRLDPVHIQRLKTSMSSNVGQGEKIILQEGTKELVAGAHRLEAAKQLHWTVMDADVRKLTDFEAAETALATQVLHRPLSPIELGKATDRILNNTKWKLRGDKKRELALSMGIRGKGGKPASMKTIQGYLTTFRKLNDEVKPIVEKAYSEARITTKEIRLIQTLSKPMQIAMKELDNIKDPAKAKAFVQAFVKANKPIAKVTASQMDQDKADKRYARAQKTSEKPSINQMIFTKHLALFNDTSVYFTAVGMAHVQCSQCQKEDEYEVTVTNATVNFSPPLWKNDVLDLLVRSIEKNYPDLRVVDVTKNQIVEKKEIEATA